MDFKAAREASDLTLKQASELSGYSIPTINALELEGRGSDRLRNKLFEIYHLKEDKAPIESELEVWRSRALLAERELAELRAAMQGLAVPSRPPLAPKPLPHAANSGAKDGAARLLKKISPVRNRSGEGQAP
jgi:transcriptional regulator with XRE-family HTH domain